MSKACNSMEEAETTAQYYLQKNNTETEIKAKGDKFLVLRKEDHKVLKSINYSPANLADIIKL